MFREGRAGRLVKATLVAGYCALVLAGCEGGTFTGVRQSCGSTGGLLAADEATRTGGADSVRGSPALAVIDAEDLESGAYRLDVTIEVGQGTMRACVTDAGGERVGAAVEAEGDEEEIDVDLDLAEGKEVRDLRYEATLVKQD